MFDFNNWGSWGIGDFYDGNEKELRDAIESGKPFDSGWHGFKKELQSMRICRNDAGNIIVEVSKWMDSIYEEPELFYDFLTDEEAEKLTDEMIEEIRDNLIFSDCVDETQDNAELLNDATFEQVMKKANELMGECDNVLHSSFLQCIAVTIGVLYNDLFDDTGIISKRLDQFAI